MKHKTVRRALAVIAGAIIGGAIAYDRERDRGSRRDERLSRDPARAEAYV